MTEIQDLSKDVSEKYLKDETPEKVDLVAHLDELLEKYLHKLDEYDKAQRELWKQLSSGYMSLAQANFHSSSSAIRYGSDYYDERMQAIRKVDIADENSNTKEHCVTFSVVSEKNNPVNTADQKPRTAPSQQNDEKTPPGSDINHSEPQPKQSPKANPQSSQEPDNNNTEPPSNKAKTLDPLRWFGILVPPALRTAQSAFVGAVEGPIPQLATLARELRNQEIEIGRVRKQMKRL